MTAVSGVNGFARAPGGRVPSGRRPRRSNHGPGPHASRPARSQVASRARRIPRASSPGSPVGTTKPQGRIGQGFGDAPQSRGHHRGAASQGFVNDGGPAFAVAGNDPANPRPGNRGPGFRGTPCRQTGPGARCRVFRPAAPGSPAGSHPRQAPDERHPGEPTARSNRSYPLTGSRRPAATSRGTPGSRPRAWRALPLSASGNRVASTPFGM